MRAAAYIRYRSGDGFGHVAWAFEWSQALVNAGAVENHHGSLETPVEKMGFWTQFAAEPAHRMASLQYDEVKILQAEEPDPETAYRVVLWIGRQPFRAVHRNCLDDTYDVLRAYGIRCLDPPVRDLTPKEWFRRLDGRAAGAAGYRWHADRACAEREAAPPSGLEPLRPTWRRPWHPDFHLLTLSAIVARTRGEAAGV